MAREMVCESCGESFKRKRPEQRYCGRACSAQARRGSPTRWPGVVNARTLSPEEAAWLAGLFDGEGSIVFMHRDRPRPTVRLSIGNTCLPLLERVVEVTGCGNLIASDHAHRKNPNHAPAWNWQTYAGNARRLLEQMLPWLIVKRDRALLALSQT